MKKVLGYLILTLLLALPLAGCANSPETKTFPPPEGYSSWEEYQEHPRESPEKPAPETFSKPTPAQAQVTMPSLAPTAPAPKPHELTIKEPLKYEIVKSWIEEETVSQVSSISIVGIGDSEQIEKVPLYVIYITIKNTDNVSGKFKVDFTVAEPLDTLFLNQRHTLEPGETKTFSCPAYILGDWEYIITPSEKTVKQ